MDIQELWTNIQGEFGKVNGRLDNVEKRLDNVETDVKDVKGEVVTINGRLDNLETDMKDVKGEVVTINGRLDNLETDMKDVKGEVVTINGRLDNVETDVKDMKRQFIKMDNRLGIVETQVKEIKYQNGEIKEEVGNISKKLDSMQNSNIANILINQNKLFKIIKEKLKLIKKNTKNSEKILECLTFSKKIYKKVLFSYFLIFSLENKKNYVIMFWYKERKVYVKVFVKSNQVEGNLIRIEGTDVNHIKNVLRQKEGDEIVICDSEKQKTIFVILIK